MKKVTAETFLLGMHALKHFIPNFPVAAAHLVRGQGGAHGGVAHHIGKEDRDHVQVLGLNLKAENQLHCCCTMFGW
jgi:shikimate 5-dehydrogenase